MNQVLLQNVIDIFLQVTDLLYQENLQPAYMTLAATLPQLEQLISELDSEEEQNRVMEKLQTALEAMEEGDNTLLADVLQYELIEQLKTHIEE